MEKTRKTLLILKFISIGFIAFCGITAIVKGLQIMEFHCENEYLNKDKSCRCTIQCVSCELLEEKQ